MKPMKIVAGLAIAGGLAAGAVGVGAGVANADPGQGLGHVPVDWRPPPPAPWQGGGPQWDGSGPQWGGPGPVGWGSPPPPDPIPGGWNGGWEPNGGLCLFNLCI
jgi:hypothetical protein